MRFSYLAIALLVSAVTYLAGLLIVSPYSGEAFSALTAHAERLETNVQALRQRNRELVATAELYRRNADAVAVAARALQYYPPGTDVIRLDRPQQRSRTESPGTIIRRPAAPADHSSFVRAAALVAFVLALVAQVAMDARLGRSRYEMRRASR